jgi:hypothetical protein
MQRLDLRAHLFEGEVAVHVALKNGLGFAAGFQSLEPNAGLGLANFFQAFRALLSSDTKGQRHEDLLV